MKIKKGLGDVGPAHMVEENITGHARLVEIHLKRVLFCVFR